MITATSNPSFKLIVNPNFVEGAPKDRNGEAIGRGDLWINDKFPPSVRRPDRVEFLHASWSDSLWETRHRPEDEQS
jgi:hypothetical protein